MNQPLQKLLCQIQSSIPLVPDPFDVLAGELETSRERLLEQLRELKQQGIIRQISAIFDAKSLGYESTLVAMKIPPARLDSVVPLLNAHPGISHNYLRDHEYNLWFTLTVFPNGLTLEDHLKRLDLLTGSRSTLCLPALRLYKIGVRLNPTAGAGITPPTEEEIYDESSRPLRPLMPWERKVILALQEDLPLIDRPFRKLAEQASLDEGLLLEAAGRLKREGFLRRFAAILRHQKVGFQTNLMTVWKIEAERIDEVGQNFARLPFVTHCYRRPIFPDWPYNLFAMIHARGPEEGKSQIAQLKETAGTNDCAALTSLKEFKKIRTRYFTPEQKKWEEEFILSKKR